MTPADWRTKSASSNAGSSGAGEPSCFFTWTLGVVGCGDEGSLGGLGEQSGTGDSDAPDEDEDEAILSLRSFPPSELPDELSPDEKLLTLAFSADWKVKGNWPGNNSPGKLLNAVAGS